MTEINSEVSGTKLDLIKAELNKTKNAGKNHLNSIVILLITISIFLGLGIVNNPIRDTIILVTVLFVHETGHLLFMKIYKYKNVKMFFIPLFGAAVSGSETNPNASQKAVVSLMGPLPGIIFSIVSYIIFLATGNFLFYQYGMISLVVNAFNLLPVYPLDGGHFFDYILFSRNKYIEIFFKVAAVAVLFYVAVTFEDWYLIFLAVFISFSIPNNVQIAKLSHALKKSEDIHFEYSYDIPDDFIRTAVSNIKDYRSKDSKSLAFITSNAWNRFFMKPPRIVTSLLFIAGYVFIVFLILVTLAFYSIQDEGNNTETKVEQSESSS